MIEELLYLILFTSLTVLAWKIATSEGMILEASGRIAQYKIEKGHKIYDLIFCEWCMPSVWSIMGYAFAYGLGVLDGFRTKYIVLYPLTVFGSSIVCGFTWTIYLKINAAKEYYKVATKYQDNIEKLTYFDLKERKERYNLKRSNGVKNQYG